MKKEEVEYLSQIVKTLEDVIPRLESSYNNKNPENFNKIKKFILQAQRKISEVLR